MADPKVTVKGFTISPELQRSVTHLFNGLRGMLQDPQQMEATNPEGQTDLNATAHNFVRKGEQVVDHVTRDGQRVIRAAEPSVLGDKTISFSGNGFSFDLSGNINNNNAMGALDTLASGLLDIGRQIRALLTRADKSISDPSQVAPQAHPGVMPVVAGANPQAMNNVSKLVNVLVGAFAYRETSEGRKGPDGQPLLTPEEMNGFSKNFDSAAPAAGARLINADPPLAMAALVGIDKAGVFKPGTPETDYMGKALDFFRKQPDIANGYNSSAMSGARDFFSHVQEMLADPAPADTGPAADNRKQPAVGFKP
jgi:hypothetical protein